jgi:hypothetical protein
MDENIKIENIIKRGYTPIKLSYYESGGKLPTIFINEELENISLQTTVGNVMWKMRNHKALKTITENQALFMLANKKALLMAQSLMSTVYNRYKADDGWLYIDLCREDTFGFIMTLSNGLTTTWSNR